MRIPSQFNEDSLYRPDSRRAESAHTNRRLLRLVIGLALVVVVMKQASRPEMYQTFFGASTPAPPSSPATTPPGQPSDTSPSPPLHVADAGSGEALIRPADRDIALRLVQSLRPTDQRQWVVALSRWQSGRPVGVVPSTLESIQDQLASLDIRADQRGVWESSLEALVEDAASQDAPVKSGERTVDHRPIAALLSALDDAAASRVVDGSVWRAGDFDTFYRFLDQSGEMSGAGIASIGVLPLLQQPEVFRNRPVRASGTVARAERIDSRKANPYEISEYWQLWVRPTDGADRPWVAVVLEVPEAVKAVGSDAIEASGPPITVAGRFLKRLAYQSSMGADLAPVVIGRIESTTPTPGEMMDRPPAPPEANRLWLTVTVASMVGLALAAVTMWRTSTMARRARELRQADPKRASDFLNRLEAAPDDVAISTRQAPSTTEADSEDQR